MFEFLNPFRKSPLQLAIRRGAQPRENLADELMKLSDYKISLRGDAEAICELLVKIDYATKDEREYKSVLYAVAGLFQQVDDFESEGFEVLCQQGIPELVRIAKASLPHNDFDEDTLLCVLKILTLYGSEEGAELVVAAARKPVNPAGWWWSMILSTIGDGHSHREFIFRELSDPLPEQFIAVALLDSANRLAMDENLVNHPFNNANGVAQLRKWLTVDDPDQFSYAVSATASLPYIDPPGRADLANIARHHPHDLVRIEAAWSQAKVGDSAGIDQLVDLCLDVNLSQRAQHYLEELGRTDAVPKAASEPDFRAKADFANWLAHPNELGHAPDEVEIVDRRVLRWPPEREPKPFWLIRYTVRDKSGLGEDDIDCGVIGSMTFCFFSYEFAQRPPEDCYAIHCYWEMEGQKLIEELEPPDPSEYASMLSQWKGDNIQSPRIVTVAELSSELQYPQQLVALASAKQNGRDGWLVLDGPRSTWYPQVDFPDSAKFTVLKLHVGRHLLGFTESVDRQQFLKSPAPHRDPRRIVETYEQLRFDAENGHATWAQKKLLSSSSPLFEHFATYMDARASLKGETQSASLVSAYERLLAVIKSAPEEVRAETVNDWACPLRKDFQRYIECLVGTHRQSDAQAVIDLLNPYWDHNVGGYGLLGAASFQVNDLTAAERYFLKLRDNYDQFCRSDAMSLLAEVWKQSGKEREAQELLIDCLRKLLVMVKESKCSSSQEIYEKEFQFHRKNFLRLFPALGEPELARRGVPSKALP